jgi:hypothetical protein
VSALHHIAVASAALELALAELNVVEAVTNARTVAPVRDDLRRALAELNGARTDLLRAELGRARAQVTPPSFSHLFEERAS